MLVAGALLAGCGGDDEKGRLSEAARATTTTTAPKPPPPSEPDVTQKAEPSGPTQAEIGIDYRIRIDRFIKHYRGQRKSLIKRLKAAQTPGAFIAACKKYKRYLNKTAHTLSVMKPPRAVRSYHHRLIVIIRRFNGHMSIAIGAVEQHNLPKFRRFQTVADRDYDKAEKAGVTIDKRLAQLIENG